MARASGAELVTEAILLRAVTTGESDRIVTLLSRDLGKVSALAAQLLESEPLAPAELEALRRLLREKGGAE